MAYCHDSVGIGHLRRTVTICGQIGERFPDACFLLATGTPYVQLFNDVPRVDYVKLPALTKSDDGSYRCKFLTLSTEHMMRWRRSVLRQMAAHFEPDVLLVDKAPLGVCCELVPTLQWVRRRRPATRIIFGMRDIEDDARATIRQWNSVGAPQILEECYDEIWVYGKRDVYDVVTEYRLPPSVQQKLRFMGYVCRGGCGHPQSRTPPAREILVTVGGGTDGELVLKTYLAEAAARAFARGYRSTLVGGPDLPRQQAHELKEQAARLPGVRWIDVETCMYCRMSAARLVVSMGGYNTMCELATQRKPALIIPRTKPRLEQAIRARLWAGRGAVRLLPQTELTPRTLADCLIDMLADGCTPTNPDLDMNGLDNVAKRLEEFWCRETGDAPAVRV